MKGWDLPDQGWLLPALNGGCLADFLPPCITRQLIPSVYSDLYLPREGLVKLGPRMKETCSSRQLRPPPDQQPASPGLRFAWDPQVADSQAFPSPLKAEKHTSFNPTTVDFSALPPHHTMPPPANPNRPLITVTYPLYSAPAIDKIQIYANSKIDQQQNTITSLVVQLHDLLLLSKSGLHQHTWSTFLSPQWSSSGIATYRRVLTGRLHRSFACCPQTSSVNQEEARVLGISCFVCYIALPVKESFHHPTPLPSSTKVQVVGIFSYLPDWLLLPSSAWVASRTRQGMLLFSWSAVIFHHLRLPTTFISCSFKIARQLDWLGQIIWGFFIGFILCRLFSSSAYCFITEYCILGPSFLLGP